MVDREKAPREPDPPAPIPGDDAPDPSRTNAGHTDRAFHDGEKEKADISELPQPAPTGVYTPIDPLAPPSSAEPVEPEEESEA